MNARELTQIGPYPVRRFIAEGGMAWVFEVTDPRFEGRDVVRALKMLKPTAAAGDEFQRFRSEASLLAGIDHPNLITIFDFGKDEATDCFYYTMTYVDGPTMSEYLTEHGPFPVKEGIRIFADLLGALAELHDRQIVHRDIKPANVLIGSDGRARLADLGIARVEQEPGVTVPGMAVGTVLYMSPEQARGRAVDAASDVFSVGLTLYEALTGHVVYDGVEDVDSSSSHEVLGYLVSLSRKGEDLEIVYPGESAIPAPVKAVIEKACRFFPEERHPDARGMRDALLESVVSGAPAAQASRWPWVAAAGTAVVTLGVAGAFYMNSWMDQRKLESRVLGNLNIAAQLSETAPTLLERAKDLESPLPPEEVEAFDEALELADRELVDAQEDAEAGSLGAAGRGADKAIAGFEGVCDDLADAHLAKRADDRANAAEDRVGGLRDAGAAEHLPEDWNALEAQLAALAPSAALSPCAVASDHLDRIESAGQALVAVAAMERGLSELWPQLAATALGDAERGQKLAEAKRVDALEYNDALDGARLALAEGRQLERAGDFLAARARYQNAAVTFQMATAIAPAAKARSEVRRLEERVAASGSIDLGRVSRMVSEAEDLYDGGKWKEATEAYEQAAVRMRGRMAEADLEREARRVRADALAAREVAVREGAEGSGTAPFARGDASRDEGQAALDKQRYPDAEREFRAAQEHYAEARDSAIRAMATARDAEREAQVSAQRLLGSQDCARIESETAGDECQVAVADLRRGAEAIAESDAFGALRSYQSAIAALERAGAAEDQFQGNKPRPPEIESRTPRRKDVDVLRNRSVKLAVTAVDPNAGDRLRYRWKFDGKWMDATGPEIEYQPERSGQVTVTVDDGRGGTDTASWNVALKDPKPTLPPRKIPSKPAPPKIASKPPPQALASWETGVDEALRRYADCLNQQDMRCLEQVWLFKRGSVMKKRWVIKFRNSDALRVSVAIQSRSRDSNHQATVVYQQTEISPGRDPKPRTYKAVLLERPSTGEWQIAENRILRN